MRLNLLFLLVLVLVLESMRYFFLGTTSMGLAQLLILLEMIPASLSCLISWSTNSLYFKGIVFGFEVISGPSVGISSSIKLVLALFVAGFDTMLVYLVTPSVYFCLVGYLHLE